jgi:PKD repeat protein
LKRKYIQVMLFIAVIMAFCGSASAAEQNNTIQSHSNPQTAVNDQATTSPVQNNSTVDISNNSSTKNNIQDTQSDTNPQTSQNVVSNDTTTSYIANEDPAVITFDDGDESAYTIAYPIMKQYGLVGTVYVVPAWIGTPGYLTLAQLTEMHNAGWTIADHTWDHTWLQGLTNAQITNKIQQAINWFNSNGFSDGAYQLAYPYGAYDNTVLQVCKQLGIKTARTTNEGYVLPNGVDDYLGVVDYLQLPCWLFSNTTVRSDWQTAINNSGANGLTTIFLLHDIVPSNPIVLEDVTTATFTQFIADIAQSGVRTETISEWYNETTNPAPVAAFIATPVTGSAPLTVQFTDQSTGNSLSYSWDFNNDGISDSTQINPTYTYNTVGTYTVKLTVTNSVGSNSLTKTNYIAVNNGAPVANFTATPISGSAPLNVQFTDQSTGTVTGWAWDFNNDGIIDSNSENPTYTYSSPGNYTVKLTVTNTKGTDDEIKTNYITVTTGSSNLLTTNQQGVETDLTGFDSYLCTLTKDTSVKYTGNASAKAVASSVFSQIIFTDDAKSITAGTTYIANAYVRADVGTLASQTITIIYDWYANGSHLAYSYQWVNLANIGENTWYYLELQATAPTGADAVYMSIGLGNANSGDTYWYDNGGLHAVT